MIRVIDPERVAKRPPHGPSAHPGRNKRKRKRVSGFRVPHALPTPVGAVIRAPAAAADGLAWRSDRATVGSMALPPDLRLRGLGLSIHLFRKGRRFHGSWMVLRP